MASRALSRGRRGFPRHLPRPDPSSEDQSGRDAAQVTQRRLFLVIFLRGFFGCFSSNTTACAIAAFSRFSPSGVLAFKPTQSERTPNSFATRARIAAACGPILGAARIRLVSTFATPYPASCTRLKASRRKTAESASFHFGSEG